MKREFILTGPPGSGKGTQTKMLSKDLNLPHIDTGALLREEIASGSENGMRIAGFINKGHLAPIELVSAAIKKRLMKDDCKNGFILDGYPRSIEQAEALDIILKEIDKNSAAELKVFYFEIPQEKLIDRLVNRRTCSNCGAIYNLKTMKIKDAGICPKCGGKLSRRDDDNEETAKQRFETYFNQTAPVIELYKTRGLLNTINADAEIDDIYKTLKEAVK